MNGCWWQRRFDAAATAGAGESCAQRYEPWACGVAATEEEQNQKPEPPDGVAGVVSSGY